MGLTTFSRLFLYHKFAETSVERFMFHLIFQIVIQLLFFVMKQCQLDFCCAYHVALHFWFRKLFFVECFVNQFLTL